MQFPIYHLDCPTSVFHKLSERTVKDSGLFFDLLQLNPDFHVFGKNCGYEFGNMRAEPLLNSDNGILISFRVILKFEICSEAFPIIHNKIDSEKFFVPDQNSLLLLNIYIYPVKI